jgi:RNA polymerase sigma factor (sigma-70 family)
MAGSQARRPLSLEAPVAAWRESGATLEETAAVAAADPRLEAVTAHGDLHEALDGLPEGEKRIITLRFFDGCSQPQVARRLGMSQMNVSRLERRALGRLRSRLAAADLEEQAA